jgi:hypothetical protein
MKIPITILLVLLVFAGCVGNAEVNRVLDQEQNRVNLVASSMQQRTFDLSKDSLIKAFINAFSNKNLTVLTLEKGVGYMMSEGHQFLDKNALIKISRERNNQFNKDLGSASFNSFAISNSDLRITVNLYEKEKKRTLAKIKINPSHQNCIICGDGICQDLPGLEKKYCPLPPAMVQMWYQQIWDEIEKSIFMQRETILEK